jgi:hypothetical protein
MRPVALDAIPEKAYRRAMAGVPEVSPEAIQTAVEDALSRVLPDDLGGRSHLARAVVAQRIAAVANHQVHREVTAACEQDAMSWDDIGHAFGISPKTARERFRDAPMGLPG